MSLFSLLSDDELMLILAPTSVTKHSSLMGVCKRFKALITSEAFLVTRRRLGCAEHALLAHSWQNDRERHAFVALSGWHRDWWRWVELASPRGRNKEDGCSATIGVETFYFSGHDGDYNYEEKVYSYNLRDDEWRVVSRAPFDQRDSMACHAHDGKVIIAGGSESVSRAIDETWLFDPSAITCTNAEVLNASRLAEADWASCGWTKLPQMPYAVANAHSYIVGQRLYVIGGYGDDGTAGMRTRGQRQRDEECYYDYELPKVNWVQELDLTTKKWRLLDRAPNKQEHDQAITFTDESYDEFEKLGMGSARRWGTGLINAVSYNGGTVAIGDDGIMAFVEADGKTVKAFKPDLYLRCGGIQGMRLKKIELTREFAIVRRIVAEQAERELNMEVPMDEALGGGFIVVNNW